MSQARRGGAVAAVAGAPGALLGQLEELLGMGNAAVSCRRGANVQILVGIVCRASRGNARACGGARSDECSGARPAALGHHQYPSGTCLAIGKSASNHGHSYIITLPCSSGLSTCFIYLLMPPSASTQEKLASLESDMRATGGRMDELGAATDR